MQLRIENDFGGSEKKSGLLYLLSLFGKAWDRLFFKGFYELLKQKEHPTVSVLVAGVLSLQLATIPFSDQLVPFWKFDLVARYFNYGYRFVNITPAISQLGFLSHLIMCCICLVFLLVLLAGLALISNKKHLSKANADFVAKFVRWHLRIFLNSLSFPFMLAFTTTFDCQYSDSSQLVLKIGTDTQCFVGVHLVACIVSILGFIVQMIIGIMACLWYYETSYLNNLPLSQKPSFAHLLIFFYELYFAFLRLSMNQQSMEYLLISGLVIFNATSFLTRDLAQPFFDHKLRRLCTASSFCYFWTSLMLLIACIFEGIWINGTFIVWLFTVPLILLKFIARSPESLEILLVTVEKSQSGDVLLDQLIYLMQLAKQYATNQISMIKLEGFADNHIQFCFDTQCPLYQNKYGIERCAESLDVVIVRYVEYGYERARKKFPMHVPLATYYVLFLLEVSQQPQKALVIIETLMGQKLDYRYYFLVRRLYRRIREIQQNQMTFGLSATEINSAGNDVPIQIRMAKLEKQMEDTSILYGEIWSIVQEETPNLQRLFRIGKSIRLKLDLIRKTWTEIHKNAMNNRIKYLLCYGNFLRSIASDQVNSQKYIDEAKQLLLMSINRQTDMNFMTETQNINEVSMPMIVISASNANFGCIVKINKAASLFFKYLPNELIGKNVKVLIPETFNMHHDAYLERSLRNKKLMFMAKTRIVFGVNSKGYLLQLAINVKAMFGSVPLFMAQIRSFSHHDSSAFILTDYKGRIEAGSANIISFFNLSAKSFRNWPSMNNFFPGLFEKRHALLNESEEALQPENISDDINRHVDNKRTFMVSAVQNQHFLMLKEYYIFKIRSISTAKQCNLCPNLVTSEFKFVVNLRRKELMGYFTKINESKMMQSSSDIHHFHRMHKMKHKLHPGIESIDAEDIRVFRLEQGKITGVDEDKDKKDDFAITQAQDAERRKAKEKELAENQRISEFIRIEVTKLQENKKALRNSSMPRQTKLYLVTLIILIVTLVVLSVFGFFQIKSLWTQIDRYFTFTATYGTVVNDLLNVCQAIQRLVILNNFPSNQTSEKELRDFLTREGDNLQLTLIKLNRNENYLVDDFLKNLLLEQPINFSNNITTSNSTNYIDAMKFLSSSIVIMQSLSLSQFDLNSNSVALNFLYSILLSDFYEVMMDNILNVEIHLNELLSQSQLTTILMCIMGIITIAAIFLTILHKKFSARLVNEYMKFFLDVPIRNCKKYFFKCEIFIRRLEMRVFDQDDCDLEELDMPEEHNDRSDLIDRKRRRRTAINIVTSKYLAFKVVLGILIVLGIFYLSYRVQIATNNHFISHNLEVSLMSRMSTTYHIVLNRQLLRYLAALSTPSIAITDLIFKEEFYGLSKFNFQFEQLFLNNAGKSSALYESTVNHMRTASLCDLLYLKEFLYEAYYKPSQADCNILASNDSTKQIAASGIALTFSSYQKVIRELSDTLIKIKQASSLQSIEEFSIGTCREVRPFNPFCIMEGDDLQKAFMIQNYYVSYFSKQLLGIFLVFVETLDVPFFDQLYNWKYLFTSLVLLSVIYWLVVREFLGDYRWIQRAQTIVFLIPLENLDSSQEMRSFFQKIIKLSN